MRDDESAEPIFVGSPGLIEALARAQAAIEVREADKVRPNEKLHSAPEGPASRCLAAASAARLSAIR